MTFSTKTLVLILTLAALTRLIGISTFPPSLNWDEISHGYNAYSIFKTGKDEWGVIMPSILKAYGDYKLPVYTYISSFFISLLGLTPVAVRITSALSGIGLVITTFFLTLRLLGHQEEKAVKLAISLLAALLVAIEPWDLFLSRIAVEANLSIFLIATGITLMLGKRYLSGLTLLGISTWTYNGARIFSPLFIFLFFLINKEEISIWIKSLRHKIGVILIFSILFVPMCLQLIKNEGQARFNKLSILDQGAISQINESRSKSRLNSSITKLIFNKPVYFTTRFLSNYLLHFSPRFLFLQGGSHYQFNLPGHGLIYLINMPFFALGTITVLLRWRQHKTLLFWLLTAPVASSLTRDSPHTLRAIVMLPLPMILTAIGVYQLAKKFGKPLWIAYSIALFGFFSNYVTKATGKYRIDYSNVWQYGYEEAIQYIKDHPQYQTIIITKKYGEPHEFVLYHLKIDPLKYQSDPLLERYEQSEWFWVDRFDKFWFLNDWQVKEMVTERGRKVQLKKPALLITSPSNYPSGWKKIKTVNFLNQAPAFDILEMQ